MVELAAKSVGSWFAIVWYVQYPSIFLPHGCNSLSIFSTIEVTWGEISLSLMNRKASLLWSLILESHLYLMYDRRLSLFSVVRFVLIIHSHFQISSTCATVSQEVGTCLVKHHATKVGGYALQSRILAFNGQSPHDISWMVYGPSGNTNF